MPSREEVKTLARNLHSLAGGEDVRRKAAARILGRYDGIEATELIHHLLQLAREGSELAVCVLSSVTAALAFEAANLPEAPQLRRLARLQELEDVAALFETGPAVRELHPAAAARRDASHLPDAPLGTLKTKARMSRNPDELARLALASNPSVIRNLLLNPRLTEPFVVRVAARRPARAEPLIEIWRSEKWGARHSVRRALVFNPYLPPEIGAKILPLLNVNDLKELRQAAGIHPALREQARMLIESSLVETSPPRPKASDREPTEKV